MYRIVEKDIDFFDISRYFKNIAIFSLVQTLAALISDLTES